MPRLAELQNAETLGDLADILGYTPSGLSYLLYKTSDEFKYKVFNIPKRDGSDRVIKAPNNELAKLQRRLGDLLYGCLEEIEASSPNRRRLAHGFLRSRSIITNALLHRNKRYVLNLDLQDFFPSFNFGRVRGFFIKDRHFSLKEKVATVIAQIACYDNELPQGSPCSPMISNLVGHLLDTRLVRFAKKYKCTYSRYADDITFSTSQKQFPAALALQDKDNPLKWELGQDIINKIEHSGFKINHKKTRLQFRGSRQAVTGLIVNEKVNIRSEYYRRSRSMCNSLFSKGIYYQAVPATLGGGKVGDKDIKSETSKTMRLEGILSHVYHVKDHVDRRSSFDKKETPSAIHKLYRKFLFFKNFAFPNAITILTEGKTDVSYLKLALPKLPAFHPALGQFEDEKSFISKIKFIRYTKIMHEILQLGGGTGDIKFLILDYRQNLNKFKYAPMEHPIIIIIDNDDGAKDIFAAVKGRYKVDISYESKEPFYFICNNLYLIKTPPKALEVKSCIEDLFDPKWLEVKVDGRVFDPNIDHGGELGKYGKVVFVERVIKPNATAIDFSAFSSLFAGIIAATEDYKVRSAKANQVTK